MSNAPEALPVPRGTDSDHPDFFATQQLRALNPNEQPAQLLILSHESALIDIVSKATPGVVHVSQANDLDHAVKTLPEVTPGILLVDVSDVSDLATMLQKLSQSYPDVVTLVAGKREHLATLLRLADAGRIFRYLQIPLAHGQTRLALGAAVAQHLVNKTARQQSNPPPAAPATTVRKPTITYMAIGLGLIVAIGAGWLTLRHSTDSPSTSQSPPTAPSPATDALQTQLARANAALAQGKYVEPSGDNALEAYQRVLQLEPGNAAALAGLRTVADRMLELAERSLRTERVEEAVQHIAAVRAIDANHPRLPLLAMQVAREQERLTLSRARDTTKNVRRLIEQASMNISRQRLVRPAGANAYEALAQARRLDPADPAVALAIRELNTALIETARNAVSAGDTAQAVLLIESARNLGAAAPALADTERMVAEATRRITEPATTRAPAARAAPAEITRQAASNPAPATTAPAAAASAVTVAGVAAVGANATTNSQARDVASTEAAAPTQSSDATAGGSAVDSAADAILQAASLPRTREVSPDYPTQAALDGTEGWVDIDFTISPEGVPQDMKVRDASPKRLFDRAALASLRQWRFDPIKQDGVAVARRATLRVRFQPR